MNSAPQGMLCPTCRVSLVMSERHGVEIDYCPQCRGVWLDRGELDKIIERSGRDLPGQQAQPAAAPQGAYPQGGFQPQMPQQHYPQQGHYDSYGQPHGYQKRRKSFLEELFD